MKKKIRSIDKKFLSYNKRNCLVNLLQAEQHIKNINTLNFTKGEGACILKHLMLVKGEVEEAIAHALEIEPENVKIFEELNEKIGSFLDRVEKRYEYTKRDLLCLVRGWRKELEKTMPFYQTFNCKCLHYIPQLKIFLSFLAGILFSYILSKLFTVIGL